MQIDLNLIPTFDAAISDGITETVAGALVSESGGMGLAELLFFLATYLWERSGGEGTSAALESFF